MAVTLVAGLLDQASALPSDLPSELVAWDSNTLPTVTLQRDMNREDLASAFLNYHRETYPDEIKVQCQGAICPDMGSCGPHFPNLRACHQPELADQEIVFPGQPENCPGRTKLTPKEAAAVAAAAAVASVTVTGGDGTAGLLCKHGHRQDYFSHERYVAQYFEMKGVLMSASGLFFNESMHFSRQGCHADGQFHYKAKDSRVVQVNELVSFVYHHGGCTNPFTRPAGIRARASGAPSAPASSFHRMDFPCFPKHGTFAIPFKRQLVLWVLLPLMVLTEN
ncbi:unnamed protein product [Closterium sp. Yama58-4]|nr:unnamed protein product [Closterium sp. Yama58-4]